MLSVPAIVGFSLAVTPLVLTPGASFTLVSARGMSGDTKGAWAAIAGTAAGIMTHGALAGAGLAAVVMKSAETYRIIRLLGALYLMLLGIHMVLRSRTARDVAPCTGTETRQGRGDHRLAQAYLANVLNVKAASVYLTLAPQFVSRQGAGLGAMETLATAHVLIMTTWLGLWSFGLTKLTARVDPRRWGRRLDAVGGAGLVLLGARTAQTR